jgi:hypothetical protein
MHTRRGRKPRGLGGIMTYDDDMTADSDDFEPDNEEFGSAEFDDDEYDLEDEDDLDFEEDDDMAGSWDDASRNI